MALRYPDFLPSLLFIRKGEGNLKKENPKNNGVAQGIGDIIQESILAGGDNVEERDGNELQAPADAGVAHPMTQTSSVQSLYRQCIGMIEAKCDPEAPEYRGIYWQLGPAYRDMIDRAWRMMSTASIDEDANRAAQETQEAVAPGNDPQHDRTSYAPMPTDMCRLSVFFPLARQNVRPRVWIDDQVIVGNAWGEIRYSGPQLSTCDEDVLIAVLALFDNQKHRHTELIDGNYTYSYRGPLLPVLRLMGYSGVAYGSKDYKRVLDSLTRMMSAVIELRVKTKNSRGKPNTKQYIITNILTYAGWDNTNKELQITINPYFYAMHKSKRVTRLDIAARQKLKSPTAKAILRFLQSHRDKEWPNNHKHARIRTIIRSLNLDESQPIYKLRALLKRAIAELIDHGLLTEQSGLSKKRDALTEVEDSAENYIKLVRHPRLG